MEQGWGDPRIVVSVATAAFALGALSFQVVRYWLDGARLQVRLIPAMLDSLGTLARGPDPGWETSPDHKEFAVVNGLGGWYVDLALVQVTNIGRTAVPVTDLALDFGRPFQWPWSQGRPRPLRQARRTMTGAPVVVFDASTDDVVRLEPGESVLRFFDLCPMTMAMREARPAVMTIRASAVRAGRRRPTLSKWRWRWRMRAGEGHRRGESESPELRAYRAVWRSLRVYAHREHEHDRVGLVWSVVIEKVLAGHVEREGLTELLARVLDPGEAFLVARNVADAYYSEPR